MKSMLPLLLLAGGAAAGPCDLYEAAGTPCVAAHSVVRALYDAYSGPLYEVQRASDGAFCNVTLLAAGGVSNATGQDVFCGRSFCEVTRIYDQSPRGNHLHKAGGGGNVPKPDKGVNATSYATTLNGRPVYGAHFETAMGYRNDNATGTAVGAAPETMYMVVDGKVYNDGCCFDYGNAETDNKDDGKGTMEAVYWGTSTSTNRGSGSGPWVMADLEQGLWAGNVSVYEGNPSLVNMNFVTALVKGDSGTFGLRGGNAQAGPLMNLFQGDRPALYVNGSKQGAIVLGIGGDNSDRAKGVFFEGAMTAGIAADAVDAAVHANVQAAGYGR
ncbi:putative alpha-L-arabinofuranosidase B [Diplonema papillatum]|nr:putative alpha-L-arabinofuranosidase B [Diplonema papillatum]|eukprot:gene18715-28888_t